MDLKHYTVVCGKCYWKAETNIQGQLRCSNKSCNLSNRWVSKRVWSIMGCQGHCARLEIPVYVNV